MRELKFRAWFSNEDVKLDSIIFDLLDQDDECVLGPNQGGIRDCAYKSDIIAIEQFTGLKDKDGIEIYEGDVVDDGEDQIVVKTPCWHVIDAFTVYGYKGLDSFRKNYDKNNDETSEFVRSCRVIGNVHQNPELIK